MIQKQKICAICSKPISVVNYDKHLYIMHDISLPKTYPSELNNYTLFVKLLEYLKVDENILKVLLYKAPLIYTTIQLTGVTYHE